MGMVGFYANSITNRKSASILSFVCVDLGLTFTISFAASNRAYRLCVIAVMLLCVSILFQSISKQSVLLPIVLTLMVAVLSLLFLYSLFSLSFLILSHLRRFTPDSPHFSLLLTERIVVECRWVLFLSGFIPQVFLISLVQCFHFHLPVWLSISPSIVVSCLFLLVRSSVLILCLLRVGVPAVIDF